MDNLYPATSPTTSSTEMARQLKDATETLARKLAAEKPHLRALGVTLPEGTLGKLTAIQQDFETLIKRMQDNHLELVQLRSLARTTELINSSLDLPTVLRQVIDRVIQLVGAERGYIMLRNEDSGELEIAVARKLGAMASDDEELIYSRTIIERAMHDNAPVVTTNAQEDDRFADNQSIIGYALRSIICVPLSFRDKVIGAVYCDNRVRDGMFGRRESRLLSTFADQAAIAIENARLFEQIKTNLREITEIKSLLDNILASIVSGVITTDDQETINVYNLAAEAIFSRPASHTVGYPLQEALPPIYPYVREGMRKIHLGSDARVTLEADVHVDEHLRNLNLKVSPLQNPANQTPGVALVADDMTEMKRRDATLAAVRRYLPPAMVDNIQAIDRLALGGERRHITLLFVDVRSFDTFQDGLSPRQLMEALNTYLTIASEGIHHHTGLIDKYMGSEIMSIFNTQLNPDETHAWQAIQAGLRIAHDLTTMATHMQAGDTGQTFYRIGIHTGIATLGNVGSSARREFSAIGDSVNLAKRLQENAQPGQILISQDSLQNCHELIKTARNIGLQEVDTIQVKGRSQPTTVYEVFRTDAPS